MTSTSVRLTIEVSCSCENNKEILELKQKLKNIQQENEVLNKIIASKNSKIKLLLKNLKNFKKSK